MTRITIKRAVCYARYSPRPGNTSLSAEAQILQCENYCKFHNLEVIGSYRDDAISGKDAEARQGFQDAIQLACQKKAVFVCYSLSRFARSLPDALTYAERLNKSVVQLAVIKEQLDTTTIYGTLIFRIISSFNDFQREIIGQQTSDAMKVYQYDMHRNMLSKAPYGWRIDAAKPSMLIKDDYEQQIIHRIMELRKTSGMSARDIAWQLYKEGYNGRRAAIKGKFKGQKQAVACKILIHHQVIYNIIGRTKEQVVAC